MLQYRAEPPSSDDSGNIIKLSSSIKILYLCMDNTCNIRFFPFNYNVPKNMLLSTMHDIINEYYITYNTYLWELSKF